MMKFQAQLSWRAERDMEHILSWLHERSPRGAANWLRVWDQTFATLRGSADQYGLAPESEGQPMEVRQILFRTRKGRDYRALFTIERDTVFVMHVRGPGQDLVPADQLQRPSID